MWFIVSRLNTTFIHVDFLFVNHSDALYLEYQIFNNLQQELYIAAIS